MFRSSWTSSGKPGRHMLQTKHFFALARPRKKSLHFLSLLSLYYVAGKSGFSCYISQPPKTIFCVCVWIHQNIYLAFICFSTKASLFQGIRSLFVCCSFCSHFMVLHAADIKKTKPGAAVTHCSEMHKRERTSILLPLN